MRKVFFSLILLVFASFSRAGVPVMWNQLNLQVKKLDPTNHAGPIKRVPVAIPSIYLSGNTLQFVSSCVGCTLQLVNDVGDIEYSIVIPENTESLTLPSYLSGEYELQIVRGQFCFYGYVEF